MQSHDYVPGVSGWKIDKGYIELNAATIKVGGQSPEPRVVTITAAEWSESEIPAQALAFYKFFGDAVMQIPAEYRESAEFSTKDHSYDCDGSDIRTTLTYTRSETPEEAAARAERAKVAGIRIVRTDDCTTIIQDGVARVRFGDLNTPFVVEGDQAFLNSAFIRDGVIKRDILDDLAKVISETALPSSLKEPIESVADQIRQVIAEELRPGGMLHRGH